MLTEIPCRHTLLYLSRSSEELLWLHREAVFPDPATWEAVWERFRGIPVITRRRAAPGELIPVGVSLPIRRDGGRWRMASQVPLDGVTKAGFRRTGGGNVRRRLFALQRPGDAAAPSGASVWGCGGLVRLRRPEAVTGLPYCHSGSDLDVLLLPQEDADLPALGGLLRRLEEKWSLRIDAEVALGSGRYGKLAELLSGSGTILVKGGSAPVLCSTRAVLASLGSSGKSILKK